MSNKPLLSIGIPAYKVEEFIEGTVESLVKSKYADKLEVLIVNDGSPDNTLAKSNELAEKYSCVKVIDKKNGGHGSAINASLKHATGKYFRLLDGDDLFDTEEFDKYLERLEKEDADIVFTDYVEWFVKSEIKRPSSYYGHLPEYQKLQLDELEFPEWGPMLPTTTIKTKLLQDFNLVIDEKCFYVDQEYNLACYLCAKTAIYYPSMIYIYRLEREGQSMQKSSLIKNVKSHETVCKRLLSEYRKHKKNLTDIRRNYLERRVIVPMCNMQYMIAVEWCKSKADFLSFDNELRKYKDFYNDPGIAGNTIKLHRKTKGLTVKYNPVISAISRRMPRIRKLAKIISILTLCAIPVALANVLVINYLKNEETYYYWDTSAYWTDSINVVEALKTDRHLALEMFSNSMVSDYNQLPIVPLFPILLIFGTSRMTFLLSILNLYGIPFAAIMTSVIKNTFFKKKKFSVLLYPLLFLVFLLSPQTLIPILNGRPDIICLVVISSILLLVTKTRMQFISNYFTLALLAFVLITLRRYYCFLAIGIYFSIFVIEFVKNYKNFKTSKQLLFRKTIKLAGKLMVSGLAMIALMGIFTPKLLYRYIFGNYGDAYSAYQVSTFEHLESLVDYFGIIILVVGVLGLLFAMIKRRKTNEIGFLHFLTIATICCFLLFIRVQKFGDQHFYMLLPCFLIGYASIIALAFNNKKTAIVSVLLAASLPLITMTTFGFLRIDDSPLLPRHFYPVQRTDKDTISKLDKKLEDIVRNEEYVYVLSSSDYFSCAILQNNKLPVTPGYNIVNAHQVDKRDGFPEFFFDAKYVIVADPIQTHLAKGSQDVISYLSQTIIDNEAENLNLIDEYLIDNGVKLKLYRKDDTYSDKYLAKIKEHFKTKYYDYPFLWEQIRETDTK